MYIRNFHKEIKCMYRNSCVQMKWTVKDSILSSLSHTPNTTPPWATTCGKRLAEVGQVLRTHSLLQSWQTPTAKLLDQKAVGF